MRILELVECLIDLIPDYHVLHGNFDLDKYVVPRLGLHDHIQLLDFQAEPAGQPVDERDLHLQPRIPDALEAPETLHHHCGLLLDNKERT